MKRMFVYILLIFFLDYFFYTLYWSFVSSRHLLWALHFFLISKMRFPLIPFLLQRERWISMDPMLAHMKLKFNSLVRSFRLFVYILLNFFFFLIASSILFIDPLSLPGTFYLHYISSLYRRRDFHCYHTTKKTAYMNATIGTI